MTAFTHAECESRDYRAWHPQPWASQAACADADPLLFDRPRDHEDVPEGQLLRRLIRAAALCGGCPVREQCKALAIRHELFGVWGGVLFDHHHHRGVADLIEGPKADPLFWHRRRMAIRDTRRKTEREDTA